MERKKNTINQYHVRKMIENTFGIQDEDKIKVLEAVIDHESLYRYSYAKKTICNRVAQIIIYPFFICMIPFQWVVYGDSGFSKRNKIGRFVLKLIGE